MKLLITGFGPFLTVTDNPSARLAQESGQKHQVLEVSYGAVDEFVRYTNPDEFDILLMLGVATGRDKITPELFARNHRGYVNDVQGNVFFGDVEFNGPLLVHSTLWTDDLTTDILLSDPNTSLSFDAGNYLCNYLSYKALRQFPTKQVGFLHVPPPTQIPLNLQQESLQKIIHRIEATYPSQPATLS